jgi:hypothetical protein
MRAKLMRRMAPTRLQDTLSTACTPFWMPILGKPFSPEDAMRFLELLRIFRAIAAIPDFGDKEAVRAWLLKLCDVAKLLTDRTPTPADDAVLSFLERSISDPKLFDPIFGLLTTLLATDDGPETLASAELTEATISAGIDPVTIMAIIEAVVGLIKLIRERRGAK